MKKMLKMLLVLSLLIGAGQVEAHQTEFSTTILAQQATGQWVVQVRSALTAFEYEIHQHYGESSYATPQEFNELVKAYVQAHLAILVNGEQAAALGNGIVKLGHETSVTFEVTGIPDTLQSLAVTNSFFKDIARNQNALVVLKQGFSRQRVFLNNDNAHTVHFAARGAEFEVVDQSSQTTLAYTPIAIVAALMLVMGGVAYKNRSKMA